MSLGFRCWLTVLVLGLLAGAIAARAQEGTDMAVDDASATDKAALYDVGTDKQLLVDDLFFAQSEGLALKMHPAHKTGEHNLQREQPWESVTLNWFSVVHDGGRMRMWYECYDIEGWPTLDDTSFCYAESTDGITWTRPALGLCSYQGSKANNILFRQLGPEGAHSRVHGTQVFHDPYAPPSSRYKAVSQGTFGSGEHPQRVAAMVSPDGIRWTRNPEPLCDMFADSQYSALWDKGLGQYVIYGRVGGRGRAIGRTVSADFVRAEPLSLVLQTDEQDPADSDLYNPAVVKYPYAANVYLAFPSLYQHQPDTLDIRLAVSRDGIHWTWPERAPFIALGEAGSFDAGSLYMGQGLVRQGNELWQYYSGSGLKHQEGELSDYAGPRGDRVFSRVTNRLDGFVSADAGAEGGWFVTPPLTFAGSRLVLNCDVQPGGEVRVGLLDAAGRPIAGLGTEDCIPLTGDQIAGPVRWTSGPRIPVIENHCVRLRVEMRSASLYAFQFRR